MILAQTSQTQSTDIVQTISSVIQAIAVIVTLAYVSKQVRDATKSVKSQTYQSIISSYAEIEARIGQDSETARIYDLGCQGKLKNDEDKIVNDEDKIRFKQLICSIFNFFENLHYQYKTGLLEADLWNGWDKLMQAKIKQKGVRDFWIDTKGLYSQDFQTYINSFLQECEITHED